MIGHIVKHMNLSVVKLVPQQFQRCSHVLPLLQVYQRTYSTKHQDQKLQVPNHPEYGRLIYTGSFTSGVKLVKRFSLSTSFIGVLLQPVLISHMAGANMAAKVAVATSASFFIFGTPMLLHFLCKRYVTKMYYNEQLKEFTAVKLDFITREKKIRFKAGDIAPSLPNPFSNFEVGEHAFLIDSDLIRDNHPDAYVVLMKYDEPLDLSEFQAKPEEDLKRVVGK